MFDRDFMLKMIPKKSKHFWERGHRRKKKKEKKRKKKEKREKRKRKRKRKRKKEKKGTETLGDTWMPWKASKESM